MKIKEMTIVLTSLFFVLVLGSCDKNFDSINQDPNSVTDVPSDYLLPGAVMSISNAENAYMEGFAYASDWVQFTSSGFWPDPGRYYFEKSRSFLWDNLYSGPLLDLKVMNQKANGEGNKTLRAASMILYCYAFAMITDLYGPAPFSQSLSASDGFNKPVYDDQESIYMALLDSLVLANELLKGETTIDIEQGYDVLCQGKVSNWQKFANSLRLRMLMRISGKTDVSIKLQDLLNDSENPILESNQENIRFEYPGISPQNYFPLYDVLSEDASDAGYRISKTLVDYLLETDDPRLTVFALLNNSDSYAGLPNGTGATSGQIDTYSRVNTRYGQKDRPGIFINYSEVLFLLAEASQKGFIQGDPKSYYEQAIQANFEDLGLTEEDFIAFITSTSGIYTNLDRLLTQKWISLFGRGLEAWTEYRRTGIPALVPAEYAFVSTVPRRFLYPLTEEQTNNANLQTAVMMLQNGDALDSKIWWMN